MTDMTALQEAEGRVKAARDALSHEEARAAQAHALADASVLRAREALQAAEREATALLDAAYRVLNDRRDRLFATGVNPEQYAPPTLDDTDTPLTPLTPFRPIGLTITPSAYDGHTNGAYAEERAQDAP